MSKKSFDNVFVSEVNTPSPLASGDGVFTSDTNTLSNDFFDTLLDMSVEWKPSGNNSYEATHRVSGEKMRSASRVDLVFGSNSQLRSIAMDLS